MIAEILEDLSPAQLGFLDSILLDGEGRLYPFDSAFYRTLNAEKLRVWCYHRSRYNLPTLELVNHLRHLINGRTALEIGAGMGDLGRLLQIPMTDSYQQVDDPVTRQALKAFNQPPTRPPADVFKLDANSAVTIRRPQVVIGSWITQRWLPGENAGNKQGPREEGLLRGCETYIHIGNALIHGTKRILSQPHQAFFFPWLVSRAQDQSQNCLCIWNQK